jgi:hypothetical protein
MLSGMNEYPLEILGPRRFQQLCQALLVKEFPGVQCFPLTGPDGGRDIVIQEDEPSVKPGSIVFQVKYWEPSPLTVPDANTIFAWLEQAIKGERDCDTDGRQDRSNGSRGRTKQASQST